MSDAMKFLAKNFQEIASSFLIGSFIDFDHFIAAGSPSLFAATHLQMRPFGHNLFFVCAVASGTFFLISRRFALLFFASALNHLSRDSVKRGYTIVPWSTTSSPAIPYILYLFIIMLLPVFCFIVLDSFPNFWNSKTHLRTAKHFHSETYESILEEKVWSIRTCGAFPVILSIQFLLHLVWSWVRFFSGLMNFPRTAW